MLLMDARIVLLLSIPFRKVLTAVSVNCSCFVTVVGIADGVNGTDVVTLFSMSPVSLSSKSRLFNLLLLAVTGPIEPFGEFTIFWFCCDMLVVEVVDLSEMS